MRPRCLYRVIYKFIYVKVTRAYSTTFSRSHKQQEQFDLNLLNWQWGYKIEMEVSKWTMKMSNAMNNPAQNLNHRFQVFKCRVATLQHCHSVSVLSYFNNFLLPCAMGNYLATKDTRTHKTMIKGSEIIIEKV